jgi:hypothetical protein
MFRQIDGGELRFDSTSSAGLEPDPVVPKQKAGLTAPLPEHIRETENQGHRWVL